MFLFLDLFAAVLGLRCFTSFPLVAACGGYFLVAACGFSCCGAECRVLPVPGLQNAGSGVVAPGLTCSAAWGLFPHQGMNPSPAYAGGFFATEPPGKP